MRRKTKLTLAGLMAAAICFPASAGEKSQTAISNDAEIGVKVDNELVKDVNEAITALRQQGYSCSQATLLGLSRALGSEFSEKQLMAMSSGFRGGIGKTYDDGTCGALTAGIMALGLYTADDNNKGVALSGELYNHFKNTYGTVKCGDIVGEFKFTKCTGCCLCMGEKVVELLQRENVELPQASTAAWDDAVSAL